MSKGNGKGGAVERLLSDLVAEYGKLSPEDQEKHLSAGDQIVAKRKALISKRRRPASAARGRSGRVRVAR